MIMDYQDVRFEFIKNECTLLRRGVTGTQGRTKQESIIKMLDIIDELTGIEKRPMKSGDLLKVGDQLHVILGVSDHLIRTSEDVNNVERDVIIYPDGSVKAVFSVASDIPVAVAAPKKKYKLYSYEDISVKTDTYVTNKMVTVWS